MVTRDLSALEEQLGAPFRDRRLLELALTHSSYVNEHPDRAPASNERLELLGDALIGFVVAARLYDDHPRMTEGDLTAARAALVRGESLAEVAVELRLGESLLLGQGEEATGGRSRSSNLAGAFEALLGAIYLDQGQEAAGELTLRLLGERLAAISPGTVPQDPKTRLQEAVQARGEGTPAYRIVGEAGPEHARRFTAQVVLGEAVLGQGSGRRKLDAEREAAVAALASLDAAHRDDGAVAAPIASTRSEREDNA